MVAQTTTTAVTPATSSGGSIISPETFRYLLYMTIIIEVCIIFFFIRLIYFFTDISLFQKTETEIEGTEGKVSQSWLSKWWAKMNNFTATVEEESKLDSGHNYDGIRELDNNIPPWWTVTFIATIIFAGIYLYRYHIAHSAPLSHEEYEIAMKEAGLEKEALLKSEANKVDENTVKMLDAAGIEAGKNTFIKTCAPCHGPDGQGIVGPNLTDDYWLHKGSISDIFRSIKYGWVEKGMKSWKDDFSPMQIAQLASYVKSLRGSNPPNAKDKQGDLYVDTPSGAVASADTSAVKSK
jgi:cytochrome c oxidase cbb3-type subunit 3